MDTSGRIYDLQDYALKVGHFKLTADEEQALRPLPQAERVPSLRRWRKTSVPKRPRSVLPKSLRRTP